MQKWIELVNKIVGIVFRISIVGFLVVGSKVLDLANSIPKSSELKPIALALGITMLMSLLSAYLLVEIYDRLGDVKKEGVLDADRRA